MDRCRYIALTDANLSQISWAEKEDIQSLVRLPLYANKVKNVLSLCSM